MVYHISYGLDRTLSPSPWSSHGLSHFLWTRQDSITFPMGRSGCITFSMEQRILYRLLHCPEQGWITFYTARRGLITFPIIMILFGHIPCNPPTSSNHIRALITWRRWLTTKDRVPLAWKAPSQDWQTVLFDE